MLVGSISSPGLRLCGTLRMPLHQGGHELSESPTTPFPFYESVVTIHVHACAAPHRPPPSAA
eukprot:17666-Pyramimonas_sp.AAC.1